LRRKTIPIVAAVILAAASVASIQRIPRGKVGVVESADSIDLLDKGLHLRPPWRRAVLYPVEPEVISLTASARTPGGRFTAEVGIELSLSQAEVTSIHRSYRGRYAETLIGPLVGDYLRRDVDLFDSYATEDGRRQIEQGMIQSLGASLDPYGISLHAVQLRSLDLVIDEEDAEIVEIAERYGGKVVILGCDAFDWQIYREISKHRPMPNIERLLTEGATGDLISIEPLVSPMIWTTIATGVEPHIHGIIDFLTKDEESGEDIPITSTMRRVPALWNMLTRFGITSGFIGWLGSYPAEPVSGFVVSDRIVYHTFDPRWRKGTYEEPGHDDVSGLTYPERLINDVRSHITDYSDVSYSTLRDYINVTPEEITPDARTFDPLDPVRNLRLIIAANATYERVAEYAYHEYAPDVLAVYLDMIDTVCHLFIKHMDPPTSDVSSEDVARYGDAVAAAYVHTDSLIGKWLDLIDNETTIVLISDHGFKSGAIRPAGPSAIGGGQAIKWHRLKGSIALYGHRVKRGATIAEASVLDVTPTILRLVGLPVAEDMPGRVLEEAFDEGWIAASARVGTIDTYGIRSATGTAARRREEEEAILERLKALGYVGRGSIGLKRIASSHFARGETDKAIEIWHDVLEEEPDNVEILTAIANAIVQSRSSEEAIPYLEKAIEHDPGFADARNLLAICYINMNRLDEAAALSRQILAEDPQNAEAYFNLGVVANLTGSHGQALSMFKRSVELRPDYDESRINLANEYLRRGNFEQARIHLEIATEINPASPEAWYLLGKTWQGMRDNDRAAEYYRRTIDRSPGFGPARISLSVLLVGKGQLEEAKHVLEGGLEHGHELHLIHTNLGIIEKQMGNLEAAEKHFKSALEIDEYYLAAYFDLVDLYIAEDEKGRALKLLDEVLRVDPANDKARALKQSLR
jgi:tetratricopeptide (TPR) repeat protein/predicted AlkP superfamily phosphohydrolase/phosphomutase